MNWFLRFKNRILDLIFPVQCLNCGKVGEWVCQNCFGFINLTPVFLCPKCGSRSYIGRVCERCLGKSYLTGVIAMGRYNDKLLQNLIKSLKFKLLTALEPILDRLIKKFCLKYSQVFPICHSRVSFCHSPIQSGNPENIILMPVPLHPLRFRERGFNQAEIIAKAVSGALNFSVDSNSLKRVRYTFRQSELPKEMKAGNIKDAFQYQPPLAPQEAGHSPPISPGAKQGEFPPEADPPLAEEGVLGKIVILVDDVYTSGATMQECAKTLKEAGAKEVWGFVLARG